MTARRFGVRVAATVAVPVVALWTVPVQATAQAANGCAPAESTVVSPLPWAVRRLDAARVWPLTRGAITVAVVDTGVSAAAPTLAGAVLPGSDVDGGPANTDCAGHGTFLAGLIAARPVTDVGFVGVAPAATILPVRVTNDPSSVNADRLAAGIQLAVDAGARVIAVGLINTTDSPALRAAIASAHDHDALVVAPAAVRQSDQHAFPASLDGVLAVAPVGPNGPTTATLGARPTLAAPAEQLVGIGPSGPGHRLATGPELAVGYAAAAAALLRDRAPTLTAAQTTTRLTTTADAPAAPTPTIGAGIVDPVAAVTTITGSPHHPPLAAEHLTIPPQATVDTTPTRNALWFVIALTATALLITAVVTAVTQARRRANKPDGGPAPQR
ncbi:S8 family serine peptidase [Actinokineospora inagensis]|uniref:S8 family serine peptidase n=1 Tax=Actinokineospora inagensis TaxID=103730 RepID=UPI000408CD37|nr:S8 family serine peptidase [Actinokineospora inagensis]